MMLRKKKLIVILFMALVLVPYAFSSAQDSENEELLYLTDIISSGGILESVPIVDSDGNLHTFIHVRNSEKDSLIHLTYEDGEILYRVVEEDATGLTIHYSYASPINIGLVYSIDGGTGSKTFYHFITGEFAHHSYEIFWISGGDLIGGYVTFFDFQFINGYLHAFHNMWDHGDMVNMTIYHYRGYMSFDSQLYEIEPALSGLEDVMDIAVDVLDQVWYIHRLDQQFFGIGAAILDNMTMYPQTTRTFSNVLFPVDKIDVETTSNGLSFIFTNPFYLYWGEINSSHITEYTTPAFFENPIASFYFDNGLLKSLIVVELNENEFIDLYYYKFDGQWRFSSISSENQMEADSFSIFLSSTDYVVFYDTTISTNDYRPGPSQKYREDEAFGLFIITSLTLDHDLYVEGLTAYNVIKEFFTKQWYLFLIAVLGAALLGVLIWQFIKRRGAEIKAFLTDDQVGKHSKFVLVFLNIWRRISNAFSTITTIWFSNKKRSILTLAGFVITGYLLSSAIIIAQSEESAMIKAYDRSFPLFADKSPSVQLETSLQSSVVGGLNVSPSYGTDAEQEVLDLYDGLVIQKYITGVQATYYVNTKIYNPLHPVYSTYHFVSLPDTSDDFMNTMLMEGRLPTNESEVILADQLAYLTQLGVNDTMSIVAATDNPPDTANYLLNVTIVGIYSQINFAQAKRTTAYLGLPYDIYSIASENAYIITKQSIFFDVLSKGGKMNLFLRGYYQLEMNFDEFNVGERSTLVSEQDILLGRVFSFTFDDSSLVRVKDEMAEFFEDFNTYYLNNMARLLIFAIPAVLLSIFMVFESSELFSTSYEQEMNILRSRGIRTRKIFTTYLSIRTFEILIASLVSFGIAVGTAVPLIRINGFIRFTNTDTHLVIGNVPAILGLVIAVLFIISIPRIIILVRRKKTIEKAPTVRKRTKRIREKVTSGDPTKSAVKTVGKEIAKDLAIAGDISVTDASVVSAVIAFFALIIKYKLITWRDVFFLVLGTGTLIYFYNQSFISYYDAALGDFTINLFLTISGAIFTLIGALPLIIKIIGLILRAISNLVWKAKKSRFNFSIAEIGKDIKYFENITLIFLLVVLIIIPVLVVPYSKESTLTEQAYFINGSDVKIENWATIDEITEEDINDLAGVKEYTHVEVHTVYNTMFRFTRLVVVNTTSFLNTVEKPSDHMGQISWNLINQLDANNTLVSDAMYTDYYLGLGDRYTFQHPDVPWLHHSLTVIGKFDTFPMYYFEEDKDEQEYMMIMSTEAFDIVEDVVVRRLKSKDEMIIKAQNGNAARNVVDKLFEKEQDMKVKTIDDIKDSLKTPLYNIFIIEMILSLFVASVVLLFSTFTTAIKILEKRVIKHDIMKKMGINTTKIINMTTVQTTLAAIVPALIIGAAGGIAVVAPTLKQLIYGTQQFSMHVNYPIVMLLLIFFGIPALIYISLRFFLNREFAKYAPTMME
jgi:hypothetical protein